MDLKFIVDISQDFCITGVNYMAYIMLYYIVKEYMFANTVESIELKL